MRHRAPRFPPAFLRLRRRRPRRRLNELTTGWRPAGLLPARPSLRLASALATMLVLVTGGVLAVAAFDDDTVPAVDEATPDRSFVPSVSRSNDRPMLTSVPVDEDTPEQPATPQDETTPDPEPPVETPTPTPSASPSESSLPVRAPAPSPTAETPSTPTPATPDLPTQAAADAKGPGPGTPTATTADHAAPRTVLDSMPDRRDDSVTADFSFHANEVATFSCRLDGGAFRPCGSGAEYAVEPGWHDFAVQATDAAGNVDPSPAQWHWHTSASD